MKNKLQSIIKHIKTMFYNLMLCVSLKKDTTNVEERKRLKRIKRFGEIRKDILEISGYKRFLKYKGTYADLLRDPELVLMYQIHYKRDYVYMEYDAYISGYTFDEYIETLSEIGKRRLMIYDRYF